MAEGGGLFGRGGKPRDMILASALGLLVVFGAYVAGWHDAAAFGLAVIVILDLLIVLRGRGDGAPSRTIFGGEPDMTHDLPDVTYEQALAAFESGEKLYVGGRTLLVRQALRDGEQGLVLWVTDERTLGDHGLLLYPDGRAEAK